MSNSGDPQMASEKLPFSDRKQAAAIGHLLTSSPFFMVCKERLRPEWFSQGHSNKLWGLVLAFFEAYKRIPTRDELVSSTQFMSEEVGTRNSLSALLTECFASAQLIGLDVIEPELTTWLRARLYAQVLTKSYQAYNQHNLDQAIAHVKDGFKDIEQITFVQDDEHDFAAHYQHQADRGVELQDAVTTGSRLLDKQINEQATNGALLKGELTYLLAPSNVGKTRCMITMARHNVKRGKNVLHITHEGTSDSIEELIFCSMLSNLPDMSVTPQYLRETVYRSEWGRKVLDFTVQKLKQHWCYMPMNRAGLTVEEVGAAVRRKDEQWRLTHGGKGFDLIIDDYPGKLTTKLAGNTKMAFRNIQDVVSDYFVQLALEVDAHIVAGFQTNREGSRINHGRSKETGHRLLVMEDVEETWGPMKNATNVITLNRDSNNVKNKTIIFNLAKSRTGATGVGVICGGDYSCCITHDNALPSTFYHGSASQSELTLETIKQYDGQIIPEKVLEVNQA